MGMATFGETRSVMHTIIIVKGMIPMRNVLKKALCLLLALCMAASLGACYSEDNTWAAKHGDDVMPIGSYIYYLSSAYTDAGSRVSANDKILEGTIDGQGAKEWIKDRALAYIGAYYYVCDKFDELGLALTDEDRNAIENGASAYWSYYKSGMEAMGISEESFTKAYAEQNVRAQLVLEALYGEGGEKEARCWTITRRRTAAMSICTFRRASWTRTATAWPSPTRRPRAFWIPWTIFVNGSTART